MVPVAQDHVIERGKVGIGGLRRAGRISAGGIADVPVLGQLFRSKNLDHSVMELIVVVTPTIVNPLTSNQPAPPNPQWVVEPGQLGNFDKNLPKSYNNTTNNKKQ